MTSRTLLGLGLLLALGAMPAAAQVLYASDFEADDGGLVVTAGSDWEHGVPRSGPGAAHSGARCWGTDLAGAVSGGDQGLALPPLDASVAAGAEGIVVRWWQYLDEPDPDVAPFPSHRTSVTASSATSAQQLFGRWVGASLAAPDELPHEGWREVAVVLGPDYATPGLRIEVSYDGHASDGMYLDDVSVEVLHATLLSLDDFEADPGGFAGDWEHGVQTGCPLPVTAPSGTQVWSTSVSSCSYSDGQTLVSPTLDLAPFAWAGTAYLTWSRFASFEGADGVHHELSHDGGVTWELAAGWHGGASQWSAGPFASTGFGIAVDLAKGTDVRLRWRVSADTTEFEYGAWIDDFAVLVPEPIPGSGANPPGGLAVASGTFTIGTTVDLALDDPAGAFPPGALSTLAISLGPDPALPAGTPLPGFGFAGPLAPGDLLVDVALLVALVDGTPWTPTSPAIATVPIPALPALAGTEVFLQGALVSLAPPDVGLTNGLFEVLSP